MMNRNFKFQPSQLLLAASATFVVALAACSNSSHTASPTQANKQGDQRAPAWTAHIQSACTGVADNACRGKYGFSVDANGVYTVGPAPGGQVITGQIASDKFQELAAQVKAIEALSLSNDESCAAVADTNATEDTVTLTHGNTENVVLAVKQDQSCYEVADTGAVDDLHSTLQALENAYYPDVFPDACSDAVGLVQQQYALLQACDTDADCAYLNLNLGSADSTPSLDIIPSQGSFAVFTDTDSGVCSVVKPPVVANGARINSDSATIIKLLQSAITTCGDRLYSESCSGTTFDSSHAPSCVQNVCRANLAPSAAPTEAPAAGSAAGPAAALLR
ncbi:MAG: hypothetical protein P4M08_08615 [Oligoflexia bacterium]|nr:hypothetical protein [Oligoflexia bacterium]